MCQAAPGPRCASHTLARVKSVAKSLQSVQDSLTALESERQQKLAIGNTEYSIESLNRKIIVLTTRIDGLIDKLRLAVREYEATPSGMKELERKIGNAISPRERAILRKRQSQAKMLSAWRKNAKERSVTYKKFFTSDLILSS